MERTVNIREFDISKMAESGTVIAIGPPGSGKSNMLEHICYTKKHIYPVIKVWSGTEDSKDSKTGYSKFVKRLFISNDYDQKEHESSVRRQKKCKSEGVNAKCIFLMDDCNTDRKVFTSTLMRAQFKNGSRWWDNLFIIGSHYIFDMPPDIRKCVSYVFIFKESSIEERKKLYTNFAVGCNFNEFCQLMDQLTGNHTALVFDRRVQSNNMEDCVFYYKAKDYTNKRWEFGCDEFKQWHKERYNSKYVEKYV